MPPHDPPFHEARRDRRGGETPGEVGEICFSGPQIFLGYLGDPENTAKTVSKEGICYTGDVGTYDDKGLHFSGRAKLVIKPKGYQVFPEDVERHIHAKLKDKVAMVSVVGVEHEVFSEGIMAFVECLDGQTITPEEVIAACGDISAYSRPSHVVILKAGEIPLNRVAKTDYLMGEGQGDDPHQRHGHEPVAGRPGCHRLQTAVSDTRAEDRDSGTNSENRCRSWVIWRHSAVFLTEASRSASP